MPPALPPRSHLRTRFAPVTSTTRTLHPCFILASRWTSYLPLPRPTGTWRLSLEAVRLEDRRADDQDHAVRARARHGGVAFHDH